MLALDRRSLEEKSAIRSVWSSRARLVAEAVRPFVVFGLVALVLVAMAAFGAGAWGKERDWAAYEWVGATFATIPLLSWVDRKCHGILAVCVGAVGLLALAGFALWDFRQTAALVAIVTLMPVLAIRRLGAEWGLYLVVGLAFAAASVAIVSHPLGTFDSLALRQLVREPTDRFIMPALLALGWLVVVNAFAPIRVPRGRPWVDVLALVVLSAAALRCDYLLDGMAVLHWSAYLSPVMVVREGGWLLWDTPAQYGFLNTIAIAAMPFTDIWNGFYVLNAAIVATSAYLSFLVFRAWSGTLSYVFALLAALAFGMWVPGWVGVAVTPSAGPMRFIWSEVLIFTLWCHNRRPSQATLSFGAAAWVVGVLWSAESAFYCTLAWIPAYAWLAWHRRAEFWWPPVFLGAGIAAVAGYYGVRLHHIPDVQSFIEYPLAFRHFYTGSIGPHGAVWMLVLLCSVAGTVLWWRCDEVSIGVTACGWALTSYFIGNCNEVTVSDLLCPLSLLFAVVGWAAREANDARWSVVVRFGTVTAVVVVLGTDLVAGRWLNPAAWSLRSYSTTIAARRRSCDPRLLEGLAIAGVKDDDPVAMYVLDDPGSGIRWTPWLPFASVVSLMPLSEVRQEEYFTRYLARHPAATGWLVEPAATPMLAVRGFLEHMYAETRELVIDGWRITRYDRLDSAVACWQTIEPAGDASLVL